MERDPYKYFRLEARELLTQFSTGILELEKDGNGNKQVQRLLRIAHTLKGAARVVKLVDIADRAHAMEDLLVPVREPGSPVARDITDSLLAHLDQIDAMVKALRTPQPAPVTTAAPVTQVPPAEEQYRTVRADIGEMDALIDGVVETHTLLSGLRTAPRRLADGQQLIAVLLAQLSLRSQREKNRQLAATLDRAHATVDDLRKLLGNVEAKLATAIDQMDRELQQLREAAEQLRLISAGALFSALERLARDVAGGLGKRVAFHTSGGSINLDAYVLSTVQGALVQIVRNAIVHGIETEADRRAAGKSRVGKLILSVFRRAGQIIFRCEDDGRGIDLDGVRKRAVDLGRIAPGSSPSADELITLLLEGGISTSASVTDAAGRGVGLDVVRASLSQLGGRVSVQTTPGVGTAFELMVPVSVTSLQGLVVEAGGDLVTIPLDSVQACLRVNGDEVSSGTTGASILYGDKAIPFVPLARALFGSIEPPRSAWSMVIIASGDKLAAVGVDRLRGTARTVVRPLSSRIPISPLVTGASLDAEGNPQLVLDPRGLVSEAPRVALSATSAAVARKPILVVDDSLTTRMLEQSILESAGYDVDVAVSGEDGLDSARRKTYALILVDVEMPGMDGFTFVEQARADPTLHDMPIILVTSRNAPEDIKRGQDVRADGYVVKGEFNQAKLLSMIKPLVERHA